MKKTKVDWKRELIKAEGELIEANTIAKGLRAEIEECQGCRRRHALVIDEKNDKIKSLEKELAESLQQRSAGLGNSLELAKTQKLLEIVNLITAGKANEAIQELLKPMPVVLGLDIRFADDQTRVAARDEMFASLKKSLIKSIDGATMSESSGEGQ
jgi:hypothetical protein